jgi:hypothetical protein
MILRQPLPETRWQQQILFRKVGAEWFGHDFENVAHTSVLFKQIPQNKLKFSDTLLGLVPVSSVLAYGSSALLVLIIRWVKHGKPRGYLVAWIQQHFRSKAHCAKLGETYAPYLIEEEE